MNKLARFARSLRVLGTRALRKARRIGWVRTARWRAERSGVVLGPDNFCYSPLPQWDVIVDVGVGHTPTFSPWIVERTGAKAVLCDPTPRHADGLRRWVGLRKDYVLLEKAVAATDGTVEFYECAERESGSIAVDHSNRKAEGRVVPVASMSLATLLEEASLGGPVSMVKVDIEGAEFGIFRRADPTLASTLQRVPQWFVEFHPAPQTSEPLSSVRGARSIFRAAGFDEFSPNGTDYLFVQRTQAR